MKMIMAILKVLLEHLQEPVLEAWMDPSVVQHVLLSQDRCLDDEINAQARVTV
jgi:hypothetical protein